MIEAALRRILPLPCATAVCRTADVSALPAAEAALVAGAVMKRRQEFAAGRHAARTALSGLGCPGAVIGSGPDRAPNWPAGFVGSIAHAEGVAIAGVGRAHEVRSLGVDLERNEAVGDELWSQVLRPEEIRWLREWPERDRRRWATALFSAKEAFYKFQYPLTRAWLDFTAAEVYIDPAAETFQVKLDSPLVVNCTSMYNFHGRFALADIFVVTGLYLGVEFAVKTDK